MSGFTADSRLTFLRPLLFFSGATAIVLWIARRSRRALAITALVAVIALVAIIPVRLAALRILDVMIGFAVDLSLLEPNAQFPFAADGIGRFLGTWVVKSALQSAPFLALGLLARPRNFAERSALWLFLAPVIGHALILASQAGAPMQHALGFPFLSIRYVYPVMPLLALVAVMGMRDLCLHPLHVLAAGILALGAAIPMFAAAGDAALWRRALLLLVPLTVAAAAAIAGALARNGGRVRAQVAACLVTLACGEAGLASMLDIHAIGREYASWDALHDRVGSLLPQRFALAGYTFRMDPVLALRSERDVAFADFYEAPMHLWQNGRFPEIAQHWRNEKRPIFAIFDPGGTVRSPWPEMRFEPVDLSIGLHRVTFTH